MSKCKFCGSEIYEGTKFCSTCGAKTDEIPTVSGVATDTQRNVPKGPDGNDKPVKRPFSAGILAWSIVNIAASLGACCCVAPFISLILGIISLIYTILATDCISEQTYKKRLRTAKILNIIATCITLVSIIAYIIFILLGFFASGEFDEFMRYHYYLD